MIQESNLIKLGLSIHQFFWRIQLFLKSVAFIYIYKKLSQKREKKETKINDDFEFNIMRRAFEIKMCMRKHSVSDWNIFWIITTWNNQ